VEHVQIMASSTPADVKGLLKTSVRSDNPTVFVDHVRLIEVKGPVPDGDHAIPFGKADVKRAGKDVTIVATSFMMQRALSAAKVLAARASRPRWWIPARWCRWTRGRSWAPWPRRAAS
jgi:pyruvate dehydrogenase E1 component beta subunit